MTPLQSRSRTVPGTFAETMFRRWAWWACIFFTAGIAVFFTYCVFRDDWPRGNAAIVFAGLALTSWTVAGGLYAVILFRPRHTLEQLTAATTRRAEDRYARTDTDSASNSFGILVPGSTRVTWAIASISASLTVAFIIFAVAAEGGWRILWVVCTLPFVTSVIANAFAVRPRWLLFAPQGISVSGSRTMARFDWDHIGAVNYVEGYDGLMVFRLEASPGVAPTITHRHPFIRRQSQIVDVEATTFNLDPLLLLLAIESYRKWPHLRAELEGPTPPDRFTDPSGALLGVDLHTALDGFHPESTRTRPR